MSNTFYVTTPIYYANAQPHIGTTYTTIVADFLARFHRLLGDRTKFLTGLDEHGEKIYRAALAQGQTPQQFVDSIAMDYRDAWGTFDISYDVFMRTTDPSHRRSVAGVLERVRAAGDVYFAEYQGLYCVGCERFLTDKELSDGLCPDHGTPPEPRREGNWFFRMERYRLPLRQRIEANPDLIAPERYRNEVLSLLSEPIGDLSISRPRERVPWGIPIPWDARQVTYVWFDALLNYLTALGFPAGDDYRDFWPASHHLIGKDILKPHAVFWPAILMAMDVPLYRRLLVSGFLLGPDGRKMSKSLGNVVDPFALVGRFGSDAVRYYLLREFPYGQDGVISESGIAERYNADLANTLGNLVNRLRVMLLRYRDGRIPPGRPDDAIAADGASLLQRIRPLVDDLRINLALAEVLRFVRSLNRYVDDRRPWELSRDPGRSAELDTVLANLIAGLNLASALLFPAMPAKMTELRASIGLSESNGRDISSWRMDLAGIQIPAEAPVLFPRIVD